MKPRKPSRRQLLSSCNELGPDDGVDPRTFFRKPSGRGLNRKALQLCSQISRILSAVLAWETGDDRLLGVVVESVEPAPDSTRILVTVSVPALREEGDAGQVLACLNGFTGKLRAEIAAAIHRKRVPELLFRVVGRGEVDA
jgi:ribosome-binding factor A